MEEKEFMKILAKGSLVSFTKYEKYHLDQLVLFTSLCLFPLRLLLHLY